jgi:hypothetical protein
VDNGLDWPVRIFGNEGAAQQIEEARRIGGDG